MGIFRRFEAWLVPVIVLADQVTKAIVVATVPLHSSVTVIPGLLNITQVHNTGAAFGFLNAIDFPHKWLVVTIAAVVALVAIAVYAGRYAGGTTARSRKLLWPSRTCSETSLSTSPRIGPIWI